MDFSFWNWNKKKRSTVVLGRELAEATQREKQRIEIGNQSLSPLPDFNYSNWPDEQSLINPIWNELDNKIVILIDEFKIHNESRRKELQTSISQDDIYTLLEFTRRAIIFAVRNKDATNIHNAIAAIAMIEANRCDYRNVLVALSFLFFGINQLNLDEVVLFDEAEQLAQGKTRKLIEEFQMRPIGSKMTEAFGYTAIQTNYGLSFILTNTTRYNPKKNLINILFEFESILYYDKYRKGEITLERNIAPFWLNANEDKRIKDLLFDSNGCVFLRANLKTEYHTQADQQNLYVYLAEYSDAKIPQLLTHKTNTVTSEGIVRLALSENKIFCLVVQRAIIVDLKEFETGKSLLRFEESFREIIRKA